MRLTVWVLGTELFAVDLGRGAPDEDTDDEDTPTAYGETGHYPRTTDAPPPACTPDDALGFR